MAGRKTARASGDALEQEVADRARAMGLAVRPQVKVGRRLWGAERRIDLVVTDVATRKTLGIECKFQGGPGSAEERIPPVISDIDAWPIPGIVVFAGGGLSQNMTHYLYSTGRAVHLDDVDDWLRLFFGIDE